MIIYNKIQGISFPLDKGKFQFASLYKGELRLSDVAICASPSSDVIVLKDGTYRIDEGVLYIQATRTFWKSLKATCHEYEKFFNWKCRRIYLLSEYFLEDLENPPVETEVIIHRWWRNDKIKALETDAETLNWYKMKKETPFDLAISNFKLFEKDMI